MFQYSFDGVKESDFTPLPQGDYVFEIIKAEEGVTKGGDQKVTVDFSVANGPHKGKQVRFHTVTFMSDKTKPGAGMSKHFIKSIGEPFEGDIQVSANNWIGKLLKAKVVHEPGSMAGQVFARVKAVSPFDGKLEASDSEVPF